MRVFIYEFTCAPANANKPEFRPLQAEGAAMLAALCADFGRVAGVDVLTLPPCTCGDAEQAAFQELARVADFTLVVAPECQDILLSRCCWVEHAGGRSLGPSPAAVRLAADKLALGRHWRARGLRTPEVLPCGPRVAVPAPHFPAVLKPRYGAGSQATFLVREPDDLAGCLERVRADAWDGELILQPFMPGQPVSVAFVTGPRQVLPLLPAVQRLSADGRFHYLGGSLPLPAPLIERAVRLARCAVEAVAGLRGYVGVDLILGSAQDGSQDCVIELNPRLTTSYVGLRVLAETNLAEAMLHLASGRPVQPLTWRPGVVHFQPDGTEGRH